MLNIDKYGIYETEKWGIHWQYWVCFYNAVFLILGNEIGPRDTFQALIASATIIVGALIIAVLFGEMVVLSNLMNKKFHKF